MTDNKNILNKLMDEKNLNATEVGLILGRSPVTVRQWRCGLYPMPDHMIQLLQFKTDQENSTL